MNIIYTLNAEERQQVENFYTVPYLEAEERGGI